MKSKMFKELKNMKNIITEKENILKDLIREELDPEIRKSLFKEASKYIGKCYLERYSCNTPKTLWVFQEITHNEDFSRITLVFFGVNIQEGNIEINKRSLSIYDMIDYADNLNTSIKEYCKVHCRGDGEHLEIKEALKGIKEYEKRHGIKCPIQIS